MDKQIAENLMAGVERRLADYAFALDNGNKKRLTDILKSAEVPPNEGSVVLRDDAVAVLRQKPFIYNVSLRGVFSVNYFRPIRTHTQPSQEQSEGQRPQLLLVTKYDSLGSIGYQRFVMSNQAMKEMDLLQFYREMVEAISAHPYSRQLRRQFKRTRDDKLNLELVEAIMSQEGLSYLLVGAVAKHTKTIDGKYKKIEPFIVGDNGEEGFSGQFAEWQNKNTVYLEEESRLGRGIVRGWLRLPLMNHLSHEKYLQGVVKPCEYRGEFFVNL